jgi:DNA-binding transcriptional ArsR family regulator
VDFMKKRSATEDIDPRILDRLRAYTALDNPIRLRAFRLIHDYPGLPFHEIAKAIRIESGLLAYHMGVLKAAGVVDVAYERDGRQVTSYRLGATGEELFSDLFANPLGRSSSRRTSVLQRVAARQH